MTTEYLLTEIAELKASNESIRETVDVIHAISDELRYLYRDLLGGECISDDLYQAKERIAKLCKDSLNKTPTQHLADIKADSVIECWESYLLSHGNAGDESYCKGFDDAMIQLENHFLQFSKRLRQ